MPRAASSLLLVSLIVGLLSTVAIVAGVVNLPAHWAVATLIGGAGGAVMVGVGAAQRAPLVTIYGALLMWSLGLTAVGAILPDPTVVAIGVLAVVVTGATLPLAVGRGGAAVSAGENESVRATIERLHETMMLSDNAKRALFREHEIGLLRNAIEQDIAEGKYFTAMTICNELSDVFGDREEAEVLRARILEANHARYDEDAAHAVEQFEALLKAHNWRAAHQLRARIERLFPESGHSVGLDARIAMARNEHKQELESEFLEASRREDAEVAMALLRELDRYLSPDEAERYRELAGGVVARHRDNLGLRFKLAVRDREWTRALEAGEEIIAEFPNTKMADEVRGMLEVLRAKATGAAPSGDIA